MPQNLLNDEAMRANNEEVLKHFGLDGLKEEKADDALSPEEQAEIESQKKEREKFMESLGKLKDTEQFGKMQETVNAHMQKEADSVKEDEFGFLFDGTKQHQYDNKPREIHDKEGETTQDFINLDNSAKLINQADLNKTVVGKDIKSYKETMKAQQKVDMFRMLYSQEQQAFLQQHGHVMDGQTRKKVKAKLIRDIEKGRIYIDDIGKLRYKPVVKNTKKKKKK